MSQAEPTINVSGFICDPAHFPGGPPGSGSGQCSDWDEIKHLVSNKPLRINRRLATNPEGNPKNTPEN